MFVHSFVNYEIMVNRHQLHLISNHWQFDHFVDNVN